MMKINISSVTNRKEYDAAYNANGWTRRLIVARQYQERSIAPLTDRDDLTVEYLEKLEKACKGRCPTCGEKVSGKDDLQISHWISDGNLSKQNCFLQCGACNQMQRQLQINFLLFKKVTGMTFLKYYEKNEQGIIDTMGLTDKDINRIWNRINKVKSNR